jgi:hypothetical protein
MCTPLSYLEDIMKKIIALTVLGSTLAFLAPTQVLAHSVTRAWYCFASSPSASGWATGSRSYATARALAECAARTPRYQTCYIRYCR